MVQLLTHEGQECQKAVWPSGKPWNLESEHLAYWLTNLITVGKTFLFLISLLTFKKEISKLNCHWGFLQFCILWFSER